MMSENICIRTMTAEDVDDVLVIEETLLGRQWTRQSFLESLQRDEAHLYVAQLGAAVCGYCVIYCALDEGEIVNVAVHARERQKGIAARMLGHVIAKEHERGIDYFVLEVRKSNIPAQRLYAGAGFEECGVRKNFYEKPTEDALVMRLEI